MKDWTREQPREEFSDDEMAFPTTVKGLLPEEEEIPEDYQGLGSSKEAREWVGLVERMFHRGVEDLALLPKEGVDPAKAYKHITYCMRSFEPKHERKISGCAYLFSLWFEGISMPKEETA